MIFLSRSSNELNIGTATLGVIFVCLSKPQFWESYTLQTETGEAAGYLFKPFDRPRCHDAHRQSGQADVNSNTPCAFVTCRAETVTMGTLGKAENRPRGCHAGMPYNPP